MVCYGCGVPLQASSPALSGYVASPERLEEKARHKQFDHLLCARCQELSHGKMVPGVEDFAQKVIGLGDERELLTPQQLRAELGSSIKKSRSLIVLLVDLLDFSGSMLSNSIRDLIGGNPIIAVGTKMDLLPREASILSRDPRDQDAFLDWFEDSLLFKKLTVVSMHAVSSKTKEGIDEVVADIKKNRLGRDVYIVGAANVGKSAFVRAFVKEMSSMSSKQFDPLAVGKSKRLPMESSMPGTTLASIPLEVFQSGEKLYDTPGLHIHHRMPHILTPDENKELHPRKRLVGHVAAAPVSERAGGGTHTCYCWGGLVRIHVVECPPEGITLTFFGPDVLTVTSAPFSSEELRGLLQDPQPTKDPEEGFGHESVAVRGGMRIAKKAAIRVGNKPGVAADVAISGIPGWIQIGCAGETNPRDATIRIIVEAPKGIEVFVRPPMPMRDMREMREDDW
jgi:nitric-oxide synthase